MKLTLATLILVTSLASVSLAQTTYLTGPGGCGNNHPACNAVPVSNGSELSFGAVGIDNGVPFLPGGEDQWLFNGTSGEFTAVSFTGYPSPVPLYKTFYFVMHISGGGLSVDLNMHGYKGRYGVISFGTDSGTLTTE